MRFFFLVFCCLLYLSAKSQNANDLIISELMVNPKPTHGLPEKEYIEIYNRTNQAISVNNWVLQINTTSRILPNSIILPKEYAIICAKVDENLFSSFGKVIPLSAVALNNTGATVLLKDSKNRIISSVIYTDKWYSANKNAGYSLEIIDINFPCLEEENWVSSEAKEGGTPAKENSVKANKPDITPPTLLRYEIINSNNIKLVFSEKLDTVSVLSKVAYKFDNELIINKITIENSQNRNISLTFSPALKDNIIYTLTAKNIEDCSGNVLKESQLLIGNLKPADSSDVIINEVLFNPRTSGKDFVEIYNKTDKLLSLKDWALANIDKEGKVANIKKITANNFILMPKQFLVLTESIKTIKSEYAETIAENFLEMPSLPNFNDDAGTVILLNDKSKIFDRVDYSEKWHSPLLDEISGVSLERKSFNLPTNDKNNWQSAALSVGYATPTYANSQGINENLKDEEGITISPEIFTPDGDGQDETTKVNYKFASAGNYATITIFDINGRKIRQLASNQLLGTTGNLEWDGTDGSSQKMAVGYYIFLIEVFNPDGATKTYKEKVVLGSRY